jgi:hypothetical protein
MGQGVPEGVVAGDPSTETGSSSPWLAAARPADHNPGRSGNGCWDAG